jgi:hypothetical protein
MTFDEIGDQAIEMLQRRKQLSYRALKRQFDIDDEYLEDLTEELLYSHPVIDVCMILPICLRRILYWVPCYSGWESLQRLYVTWRRAVGSMSLSDTNA